MTGHDAIHRRVSWMLERHKQTDRAICQLCRSNWPCDTAQLAENIDTLLKENERLRMAAINLANEAGAVVDNGFIDVGYGLLTLKQRVEKMRAELGTEAA